MTTVVEQHDLNQAAPPRPTGWRRLTAPGWLRVAWLTPLLGLIGLGIVVGLRAIAGWEPLIETKSAVTVALLTAAPIGYLAGLGCFDYWLYYMSGGPTRPEDHSGHGARCW